MNMAAGIGSAQCPKCSRSAGQWSEPRMVHVCASCGAPLIRWRASFALKLYRIIPVAELMRIAGSLLTVAAIILALALPAGIRGAMFMIAAALLTFGAADLVQETSALKARRSHNDAIIGRPKTIRWSAFARLAVGLICIALGLMGFVVWSSITTEI